MNQPTMTTALSVFSYEGNAVTFRDVDGTLMVNATEMAKAFNKRTSDWLKNQSTREFIATLGGVKKIVPSDLVRVANGDNGGTWMHEDVALEFSRWLSPEFGIWCNDRIKELLANGKVELSARTNSEIGRMEVKVKFADLMSDRLRLNEASRLGLYQQIGDEYGLKLPAYVKSEGILRSASELLKSISSPMSAQRFNARLVELGYLEEKERPSSKCGSKKFKSITDKGLEYGQNMTSPKNQNETQPHWYESRFKELYEIIAI